MDFESARGGILFILTGPSGVGKDALITFLKREKFPLYYVVTITTRRPRPGEIDGVNYRFISEEEFEALKAREQLLEWAVVHGNVYGTPVEPLRAALRHGEDMLLKVDVQGAATIRQKVPEAISIFLAPTSMEQLVQRLQMRGTESPLEQKARMRDAEREMGALVDFDYVVVNREGRLEEAVTAVKAIITAERCRVRARRITL